MSRGLARSLSLVAYPTNSSLRSLTDFGVSPEKERIDHLYKSNSGLVQAKLRGFYKIKPLGTSICRLTFVCQGVMGGKVPKFAMRWAIKFSLAIVKSLQVKYVRSGESVDAEQRLAFQDHHLPSLDQLRDDQLEVVNKCKSLEVGSDLRHWTTIQCPSNLVQMWMQFTKPTRDDKTR